MPNFMAKTAQTNESFDTRWDNRYCAFQDLYLAAYLYAHGFELVNVKQNSPGNIQFVFSECAERDVFVQEFQHGPEAPIDARQFVLAIEDLKEKVHRCAEK